MWLRGSRLRKRIGWNGRAYLRYFATSCSIGTMFARMLRWVRTTPFGSEVAPDVKMISATSSGVALRASAFWRPLTAAPPASFILQTGMSVETLSDRFADDDGTGLDDRGHAKEEIRRGAVVDGYEDDAFEQTSPQRPDPLGTVFAPEDDMLALGDVGRAQPAGERVSGGENLAVRVRPAAVAIVVCQELVLRFERSRRKSRSACGAPFSWTIIRDERCRHFRQCLPPARCTTTCCRRRYGSSSAGQRSRPSPFHRLSSDGRLSIEPTGDPSVLSVRWFGSRHVLHVPPRRPFTEHEVRLAKAIGAVLAVRYRADVRSEADAGASGPLPGRDRGSVYRRVYRLDSLRRAVADRGRISSPTPSRCSAWQRSRVTRTARSRRACCCSTAITMASRDALPRTARFSTRRR